MDDLFNTLTGGQASKGQDDPLSDLMKGQEQDSRGDQLPDVDRDALSDLLGGLTGGSPQAGGDAPDLGGLLGGMLGGGSAASGGSPDMAGLLGGLLGGSGGSQAGGMSGLLGGLLGGGSGQSGNPLVEPIANILAEKLGLSPSVASTLVSAAIPLLMGALTKGARQQGGSRSGQVDLAEMDLAGLVDEEMQEQDTVRQVATETGLSEEETDQALREALQMLMATGD